MRLLRTLRCRTTTFRRCPARIRAPKPNCFPLPKKSRYYINRGENFSAKKSRMSARRPSFPFCADCRATRWFSRRGRLQISLALFLPNSTFFCRVQSFRQFFHRSRFLFRLYCPKIFYARNNISRRSAARFRKARHGCRRRCKFPCKRRFFGTIL